MIENRHSRRTTGRERRRVAACAVPLQQIAFLAFALLAVAVQIFVIQTHTHRQMLASLNTPAFAAAADIASAGSVANEPGIPRDQLPSGDDSANCPLCQGFAHSGQFIHGGAVLAYIPAWISVQFIVFRDALPVLPAVSHSWRGRAPPQN